MEINSNIEGKNLTISIKGRVDSVTAPDVDAEVKKYIDSADSLVFDFSELDYLSSAGLRVLLAAQKFMNAKGGKMVIKHVCATIMDVFEITGFTALLTIE